MSWKLHRIVLSAVHLDGENWPSAALKTLEVRRKRRVGTLSKNWETNKTGWQE